jgi:ABC-type glycerol-3-phosphate transport system permease component
MSANGIIVTVPMFVLTLTVRHYFVEGLTMSAVKWARAR